MPRSAPLPKSLSYLNPLRRQLAALPEEEVNEDLDPSPFQSVFLRRIEGLSPDEAKAALQADLAQLQRWLNQPGQQAERLNFVLGFLLIAAGSPEKLADVASEPRKLQVELQFPPEAKIKRLHGGWKARWRGFTVFVLPEERACFEREIELFREPVQQYAKLISISVLPVRLGNVTGFKKVQEILEVGNKDVSYALQVPGGYATAAILKKGIEWDESVFDQCLSSIQVVEKK
jgi:hypothetical protein